MANRSRKQILTTDEIRHPFEGAWGDRYPPVLSVEQASDLLGISVKTLYEWRAKGRLDGTCRKRGKHLFFWRDKIIDIIFNGKDWT